MVDKNTYLAVPQQLIQPVLDSFSDGKIQVALDSSEELRKNYPNDPLLLNIIGACFSAKGQDLEAINFYKKSLTADQNMLRHTSILEVLFTRLISLKMQF